MYYDFIIVGAGLFGCVFAERARANKKSCLIIEKRSHPFGNCYSEVVDGIHVHKYGPHIFHTSSHKIWNYINQFSSFNNYIHRAKVNYQDKLYSFPINLFSLYQLWGVCNPEEARTKLNQVKIKINNPQNLEEYALSQVGEEIYQTFIYGYTKKQWATEPKNLPSFIIKRIPIRLNFNDNYFDDEFQGIPTNGYSNMMTNMVDGIEIVFGVDYLTNRSYWDQKAKTIVYTGSIDEFYNYTFGKLDYRSLSFEHEKHYISEYQGCSIVNYTSEHTPFTRIIEHKYFDITNKNNFDYTIITKEYSRDLSDTNEKFYPINSVQNNQLYDKYKNISKNGKIIFGGRLAEYRYYNMDQIIASALQKYQKYAD
jgi:UDP-galactopyranose mutase